MDKELHILILENVITDAELIQRELQKSGLNFQSKVVETRDDFLRQIKEFKPDLILSDYLLPHFNGIAAMVLARSYLPEAPFIFVTGSMDEETAVDCMKAGASDYVIKQHLVRLGPAVQGALERKLFLKQKEEAEKLLKDSEEKYRNLMNTAADAIFIADAETGILIDVNKKAVQMSGYSREELIGMHYLRLHPKELAETHKMAFEKSARELEGHCLEGILLRNDGRFVPVEITASLVKVGQITMLQGNFRDITERKNMEKAIKDSEARYRVLVESIPAVTYIAKLDEKSTTLFVSPQINKLIGFSAEEYKNGDDIWFRQLHPEDRERVLMEVAATRINGRPFVCEYRMFSKSNDVVWVRDEALIINDEAGKPLFLQGVMFDIGERKKAEERLSKINACLLSFGADSEENIERLTILCGDVLGAKCSLYNRLQGGMLCSLGQWNVPDGYVSIDKPDGHICYDIIRSGKEEVVVMRNLLKSLYAETDPNVKKYRLETYIGRTVRSQGRPVGSLCVVYDRDFIPSDLDKQFLGIVASAIGVEEERKQVTEELSRNETKYRDLVESANSIILRMDTKGNITFFNEFAERFFGFKEEEILGRNVVGTIVPESDRSGNNLALLLKEIEHDPEAYANSENENVRRNGERVWISWTNKSILDKNNNLLEILCVGNDITGRKAAEAMIEEQLVFLQRLIDTIPNPVFYKDTNGLYLGCNVAFEKFLGLPKEKIIAKTVYDVVPKELADIYHKKDRELFDNPGVQTYESQIKHADGTLHNVMFYKASYFNRYGMLSGLVGVILDVTELKRAHEELRKSKDFLNAILNTVSDPIFVKDEKHRMVIVNDAECRLTGHPREQVLGKTDFEFFPKGEVEVFWQKDDQVLSTGIPNENEEVITDSSGKAHVILTKKSLYKDPITGDKFLVGVIRDFTERKLFEEALRVSEERYRNVVDNVGIGVAVISSDMRVLSLNNQMKKWFPDIDVSKNVICHKVLVRPPSDEVCEHCPTCKTLLDGQLHESITETYISQEKRYHKLISTPMRDSKGNIIAAIELVEDITDRIQAEMEVKRSYDIQNTINMLLTLSLTDILIDEILDKAVKIILGVKGFNFEEKACIFIADEDSQELVMRAQHGLDNSIEEGCSRVNFGKCICGMAAKTKKIQFISSHKPDNIKAGNEHGHYCVPILFGDKIVGVMNIYLKSGHARDRREEEFLMAIANSLAGLIQRKQAEGEVRKAYAKLKEAQTQLIQAEKMQVVGTLVSGVAHEVKNPLAIIIQGVNYLEKEMSPDKASQAEVLNIIKEAVARADRIVHGLLNFSRSSPLIFESRSIEQIIETSLNLVPKQFTLKDIKIIKDFKCKFPKVKADANQMEQVFINIILNSLQAMPKGGRLTIRTFNADYPDLKDGIGRSAKDLFKPQECAIICEVEDTGIGIPKEKLDKVFDPFFTTKSPGQGIGLGLSITRSIIDSHGGLINIESQEEKGTRIIITLPIAQE